jgi:hypothetical protein
MTPRLRRAVSYARSTESMSGFTAGGAATAVNIQNFRQKQHPVI